MKLEEALNLYVDNFQENLPPNGSTYFVQWKDADQKEQNMVAVKVPPGQYFVLGDNRSGGRDSRTWGFLAKESLKGRAIYIMLSSQVGSDGFRWDRLFKKL